MNPEENLEKLKAVKPILDGLPLKPEQKAIASMGILLGANPTNFLVGALSENETEKAEKEAPCPDLDSIPKDYSELERLIHCMLIENTGAHIMDSGGAYGRHWQSNRQVLDFRKQEFLEVEVYKDGQICFSLNVFHFLTHQLAITEDSQRLQRRFEAFAQEHEDDYGLSLAEMFVEEELGLQGRSWNSYNWDNILSQTLQGVSFEFKGQEFVLLQIHGGCDVRGGYTVPRVFAVAGEDGELFFGGDDIRAFCECRETSSDDGGYHWYDITLRDGVQQGLNGESTEYREEGYKLPKVWRPEPKPDKPDEYRFVCQVCKSEVTFQSGLDY